VFVRVCVCVSGWVGGCGWEGGQVWVWVRRCVSGGEEERGAVLRRCFNSYMEHWLYVYTQCGCEWVCVCVCMWIWQHRGLGSSRVIQAYVSIREHM
jgi:hypothetical protein